MLLFHKELNKKNILRVNFSPAGSYSPLAAMNTDGPDEGGRLWHLVWALFFKLKVDVEVMLSLTDETLFLWVYK